MQNYERLMKIFSYKVFLDISLPKVADMTDLLKSSNNKKKKREILQEKLRLLWEKEISCVLSKRVEEFEKITKKNFISFFTF